MAIFKKKRYVEFQLEPNKGWYIAKLGSKGRYALLFAKSEGATTYNKWEVDWTWNGSRVFIECPTLKDVHEKYHIRERTFLTEDELFIKLI